MLRGRRAECAELDQLAEAVRQGESRALVLRGEAGVGRSALLEHLLGQVSGCRVARAAGVHSEMELAFAGLHQLCAPMLDRGAGLPGPQRDALHTAFGLRAGTPPDRFLIGLAVLGLLAEAAGEQPLVCVVDDAQWLDHASAQALAFAARRLRAESVALVFAARDPDATPDLTGLAELAVGGLPDEDARALLGSALRGPVDERVQDRIVAETRGNPLALLELPRGLTPAELAVGFGSSDATALSTRIEQSYRQRLAVLDHETRSLLLVAAAEPIGDPVLVWRAAEQLGIRVEAAAPAAAAGLLEIGAIVRFRHPLVRSAVYRSASAQERRSAHRALADATDPAADPDRRVWHSAQAAAGPDAGIADDLERSADRARARGGLAATAAFLQRAAELTPDPARCARRTLAAAQAMHRAGAPDAALRLLAVAEATTRDTLKLAGVELLRAQVAVTVNGGREPPPLLLRAARQLEPLDARLARETYLDAMLAAMFAGALAGDVDARAVAGAARTAPAAPEPVGVADLLLDGLAVRYTDGYAAGAPLLRRALRAFDRPGLSEEAVLRWSWLACTSAAHVWDHGAWEVFSTRFVALARGVGAVGTLPLALNSSILAQVIAGELAAAAALVDELDAGSEATGNAVVPLGALLLAAWRGADAEAGALMAATRAEANRRGLGIGLTVAAWSQALLCNSLGRYDEALVAAGRAERHLPAMGFAGWGVLIELVEAAVRSGEPTRADRAVGQLTEVAATSGTDWALGIAARSRAMLSSGAAAQSAYIEAVERLGRTRLRGELARAHLLYGEWLRRTRRRLDAREHLRAGHDIFAAAGMAGFARRAAAELRAAGEVVRGGVPEPGVALTSQEAQIVRLVRDGLSNPEIGARLFLSPRTVEWHLRKVFGKLDITSRRQLRR